MHRTSAALYLWDAQLWATGFAGFDVNGFREVFHSKQNAGHLGKGLAAIVASGKEGNSSNVLSSLKEAGNSVFDMWTAAAKAGQDQFRASADGECKDYALTLSVDVAAGEITDKAMSRFGGTVRTHLRTSRRAAKTNLLHVALEVSLGDAIDLIPLNVSWAKFFVFHSVSHVVLQERSASIRETVQKCGLGRIYPKELAQVGGYGVCAACARAFCRVHESNCARFPRSSTCHGQLDAL